MGGSKLKAKIVKNLGTVPIDVLAESQDSWRKKNIGRLMNNAIHRFETRIFYLLEKSGHGDLNLSHIAVTRNLDIDGTRATELARRAAITKQSMGELIAQLEERGVVTREPDSTDKRARTVRFTAKGLKWLQAFHIALEQAESEMSGEIGSGQFTQIKKALEKYGSQHNP